MVEFVRSTNKLWIVRKILKKLFLLLILLLSSFLIALPFLLIGNAPLVTTTLTYDASKIEQAKAFLKRNDPRRLEAGETVTAWIDEQDISLAGNYLINQLTPGALAIDLSKGRAYAAVTLTLPENPIGQYVNVLLILSQTGSTLSVESLNLGSLKIPKRLAEPVRNFGHQQLLRLAEYKAAIRSLNGMQILDSRMLVQYQWDPALVDSLKATGKSLLINDAERERLLAYSRQIQNVLTNTNLPREVSISEVLGPVFQLAQLRGGDPIGENAAALLALSFYFSGIDVARMLGIELPDREKIDKRIMLSNRYDFSQHFLTSAALTLGSGDSGFADSIGLFKELDDAIGGSGFSFTDIGADRAGVKLASFATRDVATAKYTQAFFAKKPPEDLFMPDFLDLPELMPNEDFKRQYGDIDDPRYQVIIDDIEMRLNNTPFYKR
ncbi:MAG: hypothetical protein ACI9B8_000512 [Sulfitobacter sp.]|jgi:hypothetical protein